MNDPAAPSSPPGGLFARHLAGPVGIALQDTPAVLVNGPRQCGKTTLVKQFAQGRTYLTMDDPAVLDTALHDPVGLVRRLDRAIIDEIQRAPRLLLALKMSIDEDRRPGRFLLTGSANILSLPQIADSLAGRMEVHTLLPLSQSELQGRPSDFLQRAQAQVLDTRTLGKYMEVLKKRSSLLGACLPGGATLETWVYAELRKALALSDEQWYLSHYRDKDQVEVDFVLENPQRQLIGIEVKAAATVQAQDFKGLRRLKAQTGADFLTGIVLYDGARALPFGEGLWAIPLGAV